MQIRVGGPLPMRFEVSGLMLAGIAVMAAGLLGWTGKWMGMYPPALRLFPSSADETLRNLVVADLFEGLTLLGMLLYFLGRVVQVVQQMRNRA